MDSNNKIDVAEKIKQIKAKNIMTPFAVTVKEDEPLLGVAHQMMRLRISGSPVVSAIGKIAGIVTVTDLFKVMEKSVSNGNEIVLSDATLVKEVMTKNVSTINRETTLFEMVNLMRDKNIHTLPVVEGEFIVGIVGRRDVIYAYYSCL
jgi:CBS-domain-containing membrane protein